MYCYEVSCAETGRTIFESSGLYEHAYQAEQAAQRHVRLLARFGWKADQVHWWVWTEQSRFEADTLRQEGLLKAGVE